MAEATCSAVREYPYLDDWTDEADEWHDEGDVRPIFGTVRQNCLGAAGHGGEHEWPAAVVPQPTRRLEALYFG